MASIRTYQKRIVEVTYDGKKGYYTIRMNCGHTQNVQPENMYRKSRTKVGAVVKQIGSIICVQCRMEAQLKP